MQFSGEITYYDSFGKEVRSTIAPEFGWRIGERIVAHPGLGIEFGYRLTGNRLTVPLDELYETGRSRVKELVVLPGCIGGGEGDGGSLLIPYASGALVRREGHHEEEHRIGFFFPWGSVGLMTFFASLERDGRVRAMRIDGGRFDVILRMRLNWGKERRYELAPAFQIRDRSTDEPLRDELSLEVAELTGGPFAAARWYREALINREAIPTLREKAAKNPAIDYASRAVVMRFRMGCKELPTPMLDQTPAKHPPVKVFLTFENVREIVAECRRQGAGPLDCCLVGWNYGGHDGAFPQLFPVEEAFGGERELRKTIASVKGAGFHIGLHDNYFDGYTIADSFRFEDVNREADGSPSLSGQYGGGQSYQLCPERALANAVRNFERVRDFELNGLYFCDVFTVWPLQKCYDPKHPLSRRQCALRRKRLLCMAHDELGAIMSEGGQDWALPELDRCYDLVDTPAMPPWCDRELPLYQAAWHGYLIYNTYRGAINTWPGEALYLRNLSLGSLPTVYWHYIFNPAWNADNGWDPAKDLRFDRESLPREAARIRRITDDVARLEAIRFAELTDYVEHSPTLTETVYSNGRSCFANYATEPVRLPCGTVIEAMNFALISKGEKP